MVEWLTLIFDSRVFLRMNAAFGFLFLGLFIWYYLYIGIAHV